MITMNYNELQCYNKFTTLYPKKVDNIVISYNIILVILMVESVAARARAAPGQHRDLPRYRLNNFPKRQSISVLGTALGSWVPGLPSVTQTMARDRRTLRPASGPHSDLNLMIHPKYHVSGTPAPAGPSGRTQPVVNASTVTDAPAGGPGHGVPAQRAPGRAALRLLVARRAGSPPAPVAL